MPARLPSAPTMSPRRSSRLRTSAALADRDRPHRLARAVLAGADGRGGDRRRAASPTARSSPADVPSLFDAMAERRPARAAARRRRRDPLAEAADPPDLRALRHHRSALARGLPRPWRLQGPGARAGADARTRSSPRSRRPACAAAAARASRPASSGRRWRRPPPTAKYIVCNADEGDSGTFADRMIMEGDPFVLIEGMTIAGIAVGATKGYIYIRSEYPHAIAAMNAAIAAARRAGYLGARIAGSDHAFDLEVRVGAGAYVCGEETSLLESLEGKRGMVRAKPPLPAHKGLFGQPTVINNVLSLAAVPFILAEGAKAYARLRHGPLARHHADPARRQHQAWRPVRDRVRHHARRTRRRHRRRHRHRPPGARGAGRRTARRLFPARAVRHAVRLRGLRRARRADRPWRHRRVRRHRRHGQAGALRHGVLRHRILRQVHAVPDRLDARRRDHRQDHRRRDAPPKTSPWSKTSATP